MGCNFDIQYKLGKNNQTAEALSHVPETVGLQQVSLTSIIGMREIKEEVSKDPKLAKIVQMLKDDPWSKPG